MIPGAVAILKVSDSATGTTLATLHWLTIVVGLAENIAVTFQNVLLTFSVRVVIEVRGGGLASRPVHQFNVMKTTTTWGLAPYKYFRRVNTALLQGWVILNL